jgi:hypothetical protein
MDDFSEFNVKDYPSFLYKYCRFDENEHYLDIIKSNTFYFASPEELNDPIDCYSNLITIDGGIDDIRYWLSKFKERISEDFFWQSILSGKFKDEYLIPEMKKIRVLCMSTNPRSAPMWAHYAASQTGFCIKFNTNKLINHKQSFHFFKINYNNTFKKVSFWNRTETAIFEYVLTQKSEEWKYEEERSFIEYGETKKSKFNKHAIEGIYFGMRTRQEDIDKTIKIASKLPNFKEIAFMKIQVNNDNFCLELVPFKV